MGRAQVRGLLAAGWELDTQGISHADLITLDAEQLHYQVAVARQKLQQRYHVPVNWFCYPSGHYNPTVVAAVKAAGFVGLDDRGSRLGAPRRRSLPPAPSARARRHERARYSNCSRHARSRRRRRAPTARERGSAGAGRKRRD